MKNLLFTALAIILLAVVLPVRPVYAHTEAKDGKISALIHVDPEDKPQPAEVNKIHVYFNDEDGRFTVEGCFCKIKITQGSKTILNTNLYVSGIRTGASQVYLPQDNFSYGVVVSGTPKTGGFFQPFKLDFDIDVGNPPAETETLGNNINIFTCVAIVVVIAGVLIFAKKHRQN